MRENFVKSMAMQVEAQIHEESELWSTSQPFAKLGNRLPSQSEMQGKKSEKEIQQQAFRMVVRNFAHHAKPQEAAKEFRTPCEISHGI